MTPRTIAAPGPDAGKHDRIPSCFHSSPLAHELRECLETIPASMRGPEWDRASEHLDSMLRRGVL